MDDKKEYPQQELRSFNWKRRDAAPEVYGNYFHLGWTLDDLRITLGALRSQGVNDKENLAEEQGSFVLGYRQAKNLRDSLTHIINSYEERNGIISTPFLPAMPEKKD